VHLFITELFVPTNALRQFFHCFLYYKDAPIRISAIILPSSGGILSEFCVLGHPYNKENSEKSVLVHLLVQIINYKKMHGEYKVKSVMMLHDVKRSRPDRACEVCHVRRCGIPPNLKGGRNTFYICL
jgi:hypothetical protein